MASFLLMLLACFFLAQLRGQAPKEIYEIIGATNNVLSAVSTSGGLAQSVAQMFRMWANELPFVTARFRVPRNYVSRPSLESKILDVYESRTEDSDSYTVIVGPKGAGKTSTVAHVLNNKPGVILLEVSEADSEKTFLLQLLSVGGASVEVNSVLQMGSLYPVFAQAAGKSGGRRITIVVEVERGTASDGVLYMVKSAAKKLATEANVIIVLSDANAALAFGDDMRQKFIWVDGMTHDEAAAYAKKLFPAVADRDLELFLDKVNIPTLPLNIVPPSNNHHNALVSRDVACSCLAFLQVGTVPLHIKEFAAALKSGGTAADFIEAAVRAAQDDLDMFIHKPILQALKLAPEGVHAVKFVGVKHEGVHLVEPKEVALAMQMRNAIVYHLPSREYRMASRAHRTALLERWKPLEITLHRAKSWWQHFIAPFTSEL